VRDPYDSLGRTYTATRGEDPRLAAAIAEALGDARTVLNVGAGTGSYEPADREVVAVEPSEVMRAQRPAGAAAAVDAHAEALPFGDASFDAAMALLSDHHWDDRAQGLRELRRVAARRAVVFTWDQSYVDAFWLTRDYLPGFRRLHGMPLEEVAEHLGATRIEPVPLAHDWRDGFLMAFWRRPEAYLDEMVRAGISCFGRLPAAEVQDFAARLDADLRSGRWADRNAELLHRDEADFGFRLVIGEYAGGFVDDRIGGARR
jgi:SAM-dependent methyltransferase